MPIRELNAKVDTMSNAMATRLSELEQDATNLLENSKHVTTQMEQQQKFNNDMQAEFQVVRTEVTNHVEQQRQTLTTQMLHELQVTKNDLLAKFQAELQ
ncbi:MAG: hypothetical protein V2I33_21285, partial [Kangiellaceae bacterium]|nr:hypothetical protein [Kangiellaceae bacterium]